MTGPGTPNSCSIRAKVSACFLSRLLPCAHPVVGHHAAGEFQKALREDALPAVGVDDLLVVADAVERGERAGRDAGRAASCLKAASQAEKPAALSPHCCALAGTGTER